MGIEIKYALLFLNYYILYNFLLPLVYLLLNF